MKRTVALLLSVVTVFCLFTGCGMSGGNDGQEIRGTWKGEIDRTDDLNRELAHENEELAKILDIQNFVIPVVWEFDGQDGYSVKVDQAAMEAVAEDLMGQLRQGMEKYLEKKLDDQGLDLSLEEFFALTGKSMDDLIGETFGSDPAASIAGGFELEMAGNYQLEDGKLYLSDAKGSKVDKQNYYTYKLDGDKLILDIGEFRDAESEKYAGILFPVELNRD